MITTMRGLRKYIKMLIDYEKKALAADDPKSCCASNHRGYIRALRNVYNNISPKKDHIEEE